VTLHVWVGDGPAYVVAGTSANWTVYVSYGSPANATNNGTTNGTSTGLPPTLHVALSVVLEGSDGTATIAPAQLDLVAGRVSTAQVVATPSVTAALAQDTLRVQAAGPDAVGEGSATFVVI
jgi:hypothetical protein